MKKVLLFLCMAGLLVLIGACGEGGFWPEESQTQTPIPEAAPEEQGEKSLDDIWDNLEYQYPTVTYADIKTGKYRDEYVCIEGIVDNIAKKGNEYVFDVYFPHGQTYEKDRGQLNADDGLEFSDLLNIKNRNIVKFCVLVHEDDSFGASSTSLAMRITGQTNEDVASQYLSEYKSSCKEMDYLAVVRNPDLYKSSLYKIEGTVYRMLEEKKYDMWTKLLVLTNEEYLIYLYLLHYDFAVFDERILEGDNIIAYGTLSGLEPYSSVYAINDTVPHIYVDYIENNHQ